MDLKISTMACEIKSRP